MASELGHLAAECHDAMADICVCLGGYVVEEIGVGELLLAFSSPEFAMEFACAAKCEVHAAVMRSAALQGAGLGALTPPVPSERGLASKQLTPSTEGEDGLPPPSPAGRGAFTGFLAAGIACVGAVSRGQSGVGGGGVPSLKMGPPISVPLLKSMRVPSREGSVAAFANTHPVTGRCTYSSPALNKAARAKSRARGGQVLFADPPAADGVSPAGSSLGSPSGALRPVGSARLRGFAESVALSELVVLRAPAGLPRRPPSAAPPPETPATSTEPPHSSRRSRHR